MAEATRIIIFDGDGKPVLFQDTTDDAYAIRVLHEAQARGLSGALVRTEDPATIEEVSNGLGEG